MSLFNSFEEIKAWKVSYNLTLKIYNITKDGLLAKDYGLKDQIQRSSVSIPSNISEGFERDSKKEFIRFLYIAKGSAGELRTQIYLAKDLGYINENLCVDLIDDVKHISAMIYNLIKYLKNVKT